MAKVVRAYPRRGLHVILDNSSTHCTPAVRPRAGARVLQRGRVPGAPWVTTTGSRQAPLEGFDLHANVAVAANNRDGLAQLARYVLRPAVAQERLTLTADGRVLLTLKAEWSDVTTRSCSTRSSCWNGWRRSRRARVSTSSCGSSMPIRMIPPTRRTPTCCTTLHEREAAVRSITTVRSRSPRLVAPEGLR